nr:MAG TPA: hypothetical protein [Caudoviricetes sp.]
MKLLKYFLFQILDYIPVYKFSFYYIIILSIYISPFTRLYLII